MAAPRRLTFLIYLTEKFATKAAKQRLEMFVWISPARNIANLADCMCARSKYCVIRLNNRRDKSTMPLGKCIFWSFTLRPFVHVAIECISQGKSVSQCARSCKWKEAALLVRRSGGKSPPTLAVYYQRGCGYRCFVFVAEAIRMLAAAGAAVRALVTLLRFQWLGD